MEGGSGMGSPPSSQGECTRCLSPDRLLSCRLRQRPLGTPLQQPVPVPEWSPMQPHHRRLRVRRRLPRLALRGALRAGHPWQGLPAAVPVPPRRQLRPPHRGVSLRARLHRRLVSKTHKIPGGAGWGGSTCRPSRRPQGPHLLLAVHRVGGTDGGSGQP